MDTILNLGNPGKDMNAVSRLILPDHSRKVLKLTGAQLSVGPDLQVTSALYGAGMTLDCLEEAHMLGALRAGDRLMLVGSMGSLCEQIKLGDIVLPNPCVCAYYGYENLELHQDEELLRTLQGTFASQGTSSIAYRHGSSFAVFDPHTDYKEYKSALYDESVKGVDCGEVFISLEFANRRQLQAAAVLYCSDSPKDHISDIGEEQFAERAAEFDVLLNKTAAQVLRQS